MTDQVIWTQEVSWHYVEKKQWKSWTITPCSGSCNLLWFCIPRYWTYGQCFTNLAERISVMCSFWCRGCPHTSYTNDAIHPHSTADYIVSALCLALCWALGTQRWKGLVLVQFAALLWGFERISNSWRPSEKLICCPWNVKVLFALRRKDFSDVLLIQLPDISLSHVHQWTMAFCAEMRQVGNL